MATKTWFGGHGKFDNPNDWSPIGVPQAGDTAVIETGTVEVRNESVSDVTILLHGTSQATEPELLLRHAVLNSNILLNGLPPLGVSAFYGELSVSGTVTSAGNIALGSGRSPGAGGNLAIDIGNHSAFINTGAIILENGSLTVNGTDANGRGNGWRDEHARDGGVFVNDGTVTDFGGLVRIDAPVVGNGTFAAPPSSLSAEFDFVDSVGQGVTVALSGEQFPDLVAIENPLQFMAAITGFGSGLPNSIELPNTAVTSETFADDHLKLFDDGKLVANLNIIGDFATANFALKADVNGGTTITFTHPASTMAMASADPAVAVPVPQTWS